MHEEREFRSHARPGNHALISGWQREPPNVLVTPKLVSSLTAALSLFRDVAPRDDDLKV
jgi:hypothetical protein